MKNKLLRLSLLSMLCILFGGGIYAALHAATANETLTVDFEGTVASYTDWTFTNIKTQCTNSGVTPHGGSYFGNTDSKTTGSIVTNEKIASPTSIQFFVSKESTNSNAATWYVKVSADGTEWTTVGDGQSAASMTKGEWVEVNRDLTSYSDVYVGIFYEGNTAKRDIDDVTLSYISSGPTDNRTATTVTFADGYATSGAVGTQIDLPTATVKAGDNPINATVTWSSSNEDVAEIVDNKVSLKAAGTAVITASFAGDNSNKPSSNSYTVTTYNKYTTIASMLANITSTKTNTVFEFTDLLVTYVKNNYTYVSDGTDAIQFYGSASGLAAGDKITGSISGNLYAYKNLPEITDFTLTVTSKTEGNEVTFTPIAPDALGDNINKPIIIDNAVFVSAGDNNNYNFKVGETQFVVRNAWSVDLSSLVADKAYKLTGMGSVYNTTNQLNLISFEDATTDPAGFRDIVADLTSAALLPEGAAQWDDVSTGIAVAEDGTLSRIAKEGAAIIFNGKWHSTQYGWANFSATVPVEGCVKITLGGSNYGSGAVTVTDSEGATVATIDNHIGAMWSANSPDNVAVGYYRTNAATVLSFSTCDYLPYFAVEAIDEADLPVEVTNYNITFAAGEGVSGTVPAALEVAAGGKFTAPVNYTLYKEGYTLNGWESGDAVYLPGQEITPEADMTLTAHFVQNEVSLADRTAPVTLTYNLSGYNDYPKYKFEGNNGIMVTQATVNGQSIDVKVDVNATAGKFAHNGSGWHQVNTGTKVTVPSCKDATIKVKTYENANALKFGETAATAGADPATYTATAEDATLVIEQTGNGYWNNLEVTLPVVATEPTEELYVVPAEFVPQDNQEIQATASVKLQFSEDRGWKSISNDVFNSTFENAVQGGNNPKDNGFNDQNVSQGNGYNEGTKNLPNAGTFYIFKPSKAGKIKAALKIGNGKPFFVTDADGTCLDDNITITDKDGVSYTLGSDRKIANITSPLYSFVEFSVEADKSYYVFCTGSKLILYGFYFTEGSGTNPDEPEDPTVSNDLIWDYTETAPSANPDKGLYYNEKVNDAAGTNNGMKGIKLNGSGWAYFEKAAVAGKLTLTFGNRKNNSAYAVNIFTGAIGTDGKPAKGEQLIGEIAIEESPGTGSIDLSADVTGIWIERKTASEGVLQKIVFKEDKARTFVDFEIPYATLTADGYTGADLPTGVTFSGTFHDNQHGYQNATLVVPVDGTVKFTISGCQYANPATFTVKNAAGETLATLNQKEAGCFDNMGKGIITYIYTGDATTLTFSTISYLSYFKAEATEVSEAVITYKDQNGTTLGTKTVFEGDPVGEIPYTEADLTIPEGEKFRGWVYNSGIKVKATDIVNSNVTIKASVTAIETDPETGSIQTYDLTQATFYPEDHENFNVTNGAYYNDHGFTFAAGGSFDVKVGGKAQIVLTLCQYGDGTTITVTDATSNVIRDDVPAKAEADGGTTTVNYEGEPTTLTFTFTAQTYLHKVVVYNVNEFMKKDEGSGYYIVSAGDAASLILALNAASSEEGAKIFLPDGTYDLGETVLTGISGKNVSLIGQSMEKTIIKNAPPVSMEGLGKADLLLNTGEGLYIQDLTLQNALDYASAGSSGRAPTLHDKGTKTINKNVRHLSYQDTYYSHKVGGLYYFEGGEMHGTVDFMCGNGKAYFNEMKIVNEKRSSATMTANSELYVFNNCVVENNADTYNFGRAWSDHPVCIWLNTTLNDPSKLVSTRWNLSGINCDYSIAGEYGTKNAEGQDITPENNIVTFTKENTEMNTILTAEQAAVYTIDYVLGEWATEAKALTVQLEAPNAELKDGTISWTPANNGAIAYLISKNGEMLGITTETSFVVEHGVTAPRRADAADKYTIRAANPRGGFGEAKEVKETATGISTVKNGQQDDTIYNMQGVRVNHVQKGVYIVNGKKVVVK